MKLNCSLASSAAVDRLFSASAQVLSGALDDAVCRTKRLTCTSSCDRFSSTEIFQIT